MHELSIAEGIIDIVERTARANNVRRVKRVEAAVGELAAVDPAALFFAWESVRKGGPADTAELVLTPVPGAAWCHTCAETVPLHRYGDPCPKCGGYQLTATGGDELKVTGIVEARDEEADAPAEPDGKSENADGLP